MWISLEGNIGAGKTTFLSSVLPHLKWDNLVKIDEPVTEWQASGMLEKSYTKPETYGFAAQVHFFTTRIAAHQRALESHPEGRIFLSERSPDTDRIFWKTNLELGHVPSDLGSIYLDIWSLWQRCVAPFERPDYFIYLYTGADLCHCRMSERNRHEEEGVPLSYLQTLERHHNAQFNCEDGARMPDGSRVPVILIDGTQDFRQEDVAKEIARQIKLQIQQ